jgi:ribonuclease HI
MEITIYTDGSAKGNPGKGGCGTLLLCGKHRKELSQGYRLTTNNRMELMAAISGLDALNNKGSAVTIYSDSIYLVNTMTKGYARKKNVDLWKRLDEHVLQHKVKFIWVKGHADNEYNNKCDRLATKAAELGPHIIDVGYEESIKPVF